MWYIKNQGMLYKDQFINIKRLFFLMNLMSYKGAKHEQGQSLIKCISHQSRIKSR